jgi:hypothetical protein
VRKEKPRARPITYGEVPRWGPQRRTRDITCPSCGATHLFAYAAPSQTQAKEDVVFSCMGCGQAELRAHGIPERVGYRIELTWRVVRHDAGAARAEQWIREHPLVLVGWIALLLFAAESVVAWTSGSSDFSFMPFRVMRVLHTLSLAGYAVTLAGATRDPEPDAELRAVYFFGATALLSVILVVPLRG